MALYAASNIVQAINNFGKRGYAKYAGVILNSRNVADERAVVEKALEEIGGEIVEMVPRDGIIQEAENMGKTVIEAFPDSDMSECYMKLAKKMIEICEG